MRTEAIQPTPERLAKGDVETYTPREFVGGKARELPPVSRARPVRDEHPLWTLFRRGSIDGEMFSAGCRFEKDFERATRERGAINLERSGGSRSDGLALSVASALSELHPVIRRLAVTEEDYNNRARLLVAVCVQRISLRELGNGSSRARKNLAELLISTLSRLVVAYGSG